MTGSIQVIKGFPPKYVGPRFTVHAAEFLTNGHAVAREWITPGDCVAVLPYTDEFFYLAHQPREVTGGYITSLCAGKVDKDEYTFEAAARELEEELGLGGGTWEFLGEFYSSEGITDERTSIYLVKEPVVLPNANIDVDEQIDVLRVPLSELDDYIARCDNAKLMIGLQALKLKLMREQLDSSERVSAHHG